MHINDILSSFCKAVLFFSSYGFDPTTPSYNPLMKMLIYVNLTMMNTQFQLFLFFLLENICMAYLEKIHNYR